MGLLGFYRQNMYNHIKRGVAFAEKIIDDHIHKNIELYYAFTRLLSFTTFKKVTTIETKKYELKEQMKTIQYESPYHV